MKTIQTVISPILSILWLCGFTLFDYSQNKLRFYFIILYVLISWLSYIYMICKIKIFLQSKEFYYPMYNYTNMIFAVLYMFSHVYYNKQFKSCLDKLNVANSTLEKFGTLKSYAKLRIRVIWLIIGWVILILLSCILDYLWYHKYVPEITIYVPFLINLCIHINTLYDFMYMILLRCIGSQFGYINKYIQESVEQKKQRLRYTWKTSTLSLIYRHLIHPDISKQNVWILMHVYLELRLISYELNRIFGLQMVMQAILFHIFTVQIIHSFYATMISLHDNFFYEKLVDLFGIYFWITLNIIKIIIFNYICERVSTKANKIHISLNKLTNVIVDIETYEIVTQFLFQILRKPLKITGLGLFQFGFKFLLQCTSFVAMIIIFALQSPPPQGRYLKPQMK